MSSTRLADAASLTPYPPGISPGRSGNGAAENSEHSRQLSRSRKGAKPRARVDRSSRPEEERFNVGPIAPRNTSAARNGNRRSTRNGRQDRPVLSDLNDVVPSYPPPSFQEAISSPAMSVFPSTLTLVSTLASPVTSLLPSNESSISYQSPATSRWTPTDANNTEPESNSDSDDSLQIIERGSVPPDHGLPSGTDLVTRVKEDWLHRRGVQFPSPSTQSSDSAPSKVPASPDARGRSQQRPTLDLTAILDAPDTPRSPTIASPKRRFLSLSPLRTIFPSRTPNPGDRPQTAHPTPGTSPYLQSPKGSTFFRSTTSLATASFLRLPLTSISNNGKSEKRKLFSSKGKDKPKNFQSAEALDAWEELSVDEVQETPTSLLSVVESTCNGASPMVGTSPTRSVSFTYGAPAAESFRSLQAPLSPGTQPSSRAQPPSSPQQENSAASIHPLSLRDRKVPVPFVKRPVRRSPAPVPPRIQVPIPVPLEPVLTTVRTRVPQTPPSLPLTQTSVPRSALTAQVNRPSPLSLDAFSALLPEKASVDTSFWKAVRTPLPSTPVKVALFADASSPTTPNAPNLGLPGDGESPTTPSAPRPPSRTAIAVRSPTPSGRPELECGVSKSIYWAPSLLEQPPVFSRAPSPFVEEPITPTRHHYPGRPLPRPPGQIRNHVDSTFAPNEEFAESPVVPPCPEGLLIDLNDSSSSEADEAEVDSAFTTDLVDLSPTPELKSSILSPTPLSATLESLTFMPELSSTPPPTSRRGQPVDISVTPIYSNITDLDVYASRLADDEQRLRDGSTYEVSCSPTPTSPTPRSPPPASGKERFLEGAGRGSFPSVKKAQTLNALSPNEGFTYGGGIQWPSESTGSPSRISWRKAGVPFITPENHGGYANITSSSVVVDSASTNSSIGSIPARIILDTHHNQPRKWQHMPARVY